MAPVASPKTKLGEMFNEFVDRAAQFDPIDEISLQRYTREAQAAVNLNPVVAKTFSGMLAAYRFEVDRIHEFHRSAIALERSAFTVGNYSTSLLLLGYFDEAIANGLLAVDMAPEDLDSLRGAMTMLFEAGALDRLVALEDVHRKRTGKVTRYGDICRDVFIALDRAGAVLSDYQEGIRIAHEFRVKNRVRRAFFDVDVTLDDGDASILYSMGVSLDLPEVMRLQDDLAVEFADRLGDRWRPEVFMFEFVTIDEHQVQ